MFAQVYWIEHFYSFCWWHVDIFFNIYDILIYRDVLSAFCLNFHILSCILRLYCDFLYYLMSYNLSLILRCLTSVFENVFNISCSLIRDVASFSHSFCFHLILNSFQFLENRIISCCSCLLLSSSVQFFVFWPSE